MLSFGIATVVAVVLAIGFAVVFNANQGTARNDTRLKPSVCNSAVNARRDSQEWVGRTRAR